MTSQTQIAKVSKTIVATHETRMLPKINPEAIFAYTITRSISDLKLFNVVAVNKKGDILCTITTDAIFDDASFMVESLNTALVK
jgi:hypothetical protein